MTSTGYFSFSGFSALKLLPLLFLFCFLSSCHSPESSDETGSETEAQSAEADVDSVRLAARRTAPDFYIISQDNYKNRVYICDNIYSDVFHTQYDCKVLAECTDTKKNVTLGSAIRDYGRYNCETCSPELATIFDRDLVR